MGSLRARHWILILALPALCHLPVLWGEFNFDDVASVLRNPKIEDLGPLRRPDMTPASRWLFYVSLSLDVALWGKSPGPMHATNLAFHLGNVALLALLLVRLGRLRRDPHPLRLAVAGALLFGLHPLTTSGTCYIAQRGTLMVGTLLLGMFHVLLSAAAGSHPLRHGFLGLLLWILAVLAKPNGIVLPLCALALPLLLPAASEARRRIGIWLAAAVPLCLAAGLWGLSLGMRTPYFRTTWDTYALSQCRVLWRYLALAVLPVHQSIDPGAIPSTGWLAPASTLAGIAALALAALLIRWSRLPWLAAGSWMALAALLPEASVLGLPDLMFEYRMYVPMLGLCLAAAPLLAGLRLRAPTACLILLGCFSSLTAARAQAWREDLDLWREALRHAPAKTRIHANLSVRSRLRNDGHTAERILRRSLRIQRTPEQYRDLALILLERGDASGSADAARAALRLRPGQSDCLPLLGRALWHQGDAHGALPPLVEAAQRYPEDAAVHMDLGRVLSRLGRHREAEAAFSRVVQVAPDDPVGWANLATARKACGMTEGAAKAREKALALARRDRAYRGLEETLSTDGTLIPDPSP